MTKSWIFTTVIFQQDMEYQHSNVRNGPQYVAQALREVIIMNSSTSYEMVYLH